MAGETISALDPLLTVQQDDQLVILDVHDNTQGPAGSTKRISVSDVLADIDASAISGNLNLGSGTIVAGDTSVRHLASTGTTPGIVAGTGAGTAPTIAMAAGSSDTFGAINLTYGTAVPAAGTLFTVTYAVPYTGTAPFPVLGLLSAGAALAGAFVSAYSTTGFTVYSDQTAPLGSASIVNFSYIVGQ